MKNKFKFLATMLIGILLSVNVWGASNNGANLIPYCDGEAGSQKTVSGAGGKNAGTIVTDVLTYTSTCSSNLDGTKWIIAKDKNIVFTLASGYKFDKVEIGVTTTAYTGTWTASSGTVSTSSTTTTISGCSGTVLTLVNTSNTEARVNSVKIYYLTETGPTVSSSESSLAFGSVDTESNKQLTTKVSGSSLTGNITLSITGTNAGMFSVSPTSLTPTDGTVAATAVTVTYTPTATGSHSATLNIESTGATKQTVNLTGTGVAPKTKHNVNWHVGGEITTVRVAEGDPVEFHADPSVPASCSDKVFTGWTNAPYEDASVAPTYYKSATMATSDLDFYAVFADVDGGGESWTKVTSLANVTEEGIYAIITPDGHAFNGTITSSVGYCTTDAFVFDANNIATSVPTGICELTLTKVDANAHFTMYNSEKGYLYAKAASSGNLAWWTGTEDSYWYVKDYNWRYESNDAYLRTRDNNTVRTYSGTTGDLLIFAKKNSASYSNYTTCAAPVRISWRVQSDQYAPDEVNTQVTIVPANPDPAEYSCGENAVFVGWTTSDNYSDHSTAPTPLYKTEAEIKALILTEDITFYAVFATKVIN